MQLIVTMLPIVYVREMGLPEIWLGVYLAVGGLGAFIGATVARAVGRRLGEGRALWIVGMTTGPFALLIPLIDHGVRLWLAGAAWLVITASIGIDNVLKVTFRQRSTPDHLLGRMNATFRFLLMGSLAVGAASAGVIGEVGGARAAVWTGAIGPAVSWLPLYCSPLRRMRSLPD